MFERMASVRSFLASCALSVLAAACAVPTDVEATRAESAVRSGPGACGTALGRAVSSAAMDGEGTVARERMRSTRNIVRAGVHVGGAAIMAAIDDLIRTARHEVVLQFYDLDSESWMARKLAESLAAVPEDVQVYLLINRGITELTSAALGRLRATYDRPNVHVGVWKMKGLLGALHSKLVLVDGERALVTDSNIQDRGDPTSEGGSGWYQTATVLEGEAGGALREEFAHAWRQSATDGPMGEAPPVTNEPRGCTPIVLLTREAQGPHDSSANLGYAALFRGARDRVHVVTPNLNDDGALAALADATESAEVSIVLSRGFNELQESLPGQGGGNGRNVKRLAAMAKDACRLHIRWYADGDGQVVDGNGPGAGHAKYATADGEVLITGSQNLDTQSWKKSRELSVAIDDRDATAALDREFASVWSRSEIAFEAEGCASSGP